MNLKPSDGRDGFARKTHRILMKPKPYSLPLLNRYFSVQSPSLMAQTPACLDAEQLHDDHHQQHLGFPAGSLSGESRAERAWAHWAKLGRPRLIVAPMVDNSELPFRMLCRKYGAQGAYTPMLHSRIFSETEKYRNEEFTTCKV